MADVAAELKTKDEDDVDTKSDTFEDAAESTPRPSIDVSNPADDKAATKEAGGSGLGINIDGSEVEPAQSAVTAADEPASSSTAKSDDAHPAQPSPHSQQPTLDTAEKSLPPAPEESTSSTSHSRESTLENAPSLDPRPEPPSRERSVSPSKLSSPRGMQGLSGDLPAVTSLPPPSTAERQQALDQRHVGERTVSPPPPGLTRKATSGFGALLGRMGSIRKTARSPPAPRADRRSTATSITSTEGSGLSVIPDAPEDGAKPRPSLQDQFSSLRRQEEYAVGTHANGTLDGEQSAPPDVETSRPTSPMKSPPLNHSLPPGTASGMTAGPAADEREVNWDLWQQVVYEGPAAVTRTGGDELNRAIASGIPPAIRGVVWQVIAESKNEELENVYRTLKARGAGSEERPAQSRSASTVSMNGTIPEKDTAASDASSTHSDQSTAANSTVASPPTSVDSNTADLHAKLLAEKQKRESAALQKLEKAIKRDLGSRTSYSKYTQSAGLQDGLFGVCKAYALFDEGVGYAQGINFIAMPLLFNMGEEEAFTLLVRLMSKYDLRSMFTADMTGLHLRLYQFERLLEDYEPAVYCHLKRRNVTPQLYATQWFLTLFAYRFPLQLVLRIYDLIFSEGLTAILKFGIVLMQRNRAALLEMKDMSQLVTFLKEKLFDYYIDPSPTPSSLLDSGFFGSVTGGADKELYRAEEMVHDACSIAISDATLASYTVEWEESQRAERERESELELLRLSNTTMTAQIKGLEERVQHHDAEHVQMAQDVVRLKVENDALQDTNEGLKVQVAELQKLLVAAPSEVEAKLKQEMDRIMQRNIEVQNENRSLKEEMDEMEHELVNAKMSHAQTQSDHDELRQKWSNVQALLNDK